MKVMIAGGSGFLGRALTKSLLADGHQVFVLTRGTRVIEGAQTVQWDAKTMSGWENLEPSRYNATAFNPSFQPSK